MFDRHLRMILVLAALAGLTACGGEDEEGMAISMQRSELVAGVTFARLDVHTGDRECIDIRDTGPLFMNSSHHTEIDLGSKDRGQGDVSGIRPGSYTVFVWGFTGKGLVAIAYGCAEEVTIASGRRTRVSLRLEPYMAR